MIGTPMERTLIKKTVAIDEGPPTRGDKHPGSKTEGEQIPLRGTKITGEGNKTLEGSKITDSIAAMITITRKTGGTNTTAGTKEKGHEDTRGHPQAVAEAHHLLQETTTIESIPQSNNLTSLSLLPTPNRRKMHIQRQATILLLLAGPTTLGPECSPLLPILVNKISSPTTRNSPSPYK
jgi:hypothetical protein